MKKVGDIMREMGFNPQSSEATQKAFIKYLVRTASKPTQIAQNAPPSKAPEQLSFGFIEDKKKSESA